MSNPQEPETPLAPARIPVRSRRQAMDWSLVLASQGIEAFIAAPDEGDGWALLVPAAQSQAAIKTLRQYHVENRGWHWRQNVFHSRFVFDYASLAWVLLATFFYWFNSVSDLHTPGIMDSHAVAQGQWWRLFTATWLHADLAHLGMNLAIGVVLLGLAMGCYGTGVALLASYLAGAGGNVFAAALSAGTHRNLGSSGMVMASLGLLAAYSLTMWRKSPLDFKHIITGLLGGLMLFILLGLTPDSDVLAHLGGFLSGLLLGASMALVSEVSKRKLAQAIAAVVFSALVILPWFFALQHR